MIRLWGLASCALVLLSIDPAFAACRSLPMQIYANQAIERPITVRSGERCGLKLGASGGPTFGAAIVQRPAHGSASVQPPHGVIYRANPGYVGADSFTFVRKGLDRHNQPVTFTVNVAVTVVP